jgi:hypothetical protein
MSSMAGRLDPLPYSARLARLILLPSPQTPTERLEEALGPELAQSLVSALCADGQGRVGSSSP